jgi:hypothetical protein
MDNSICENATADRVRSLEDRLIKKEEILEEMAAL